MNMNAISKSKDRCLLGVVKYNNYLFTQHEFSFAIVAIGVGGETVHHDHIVIARGLKVAILLLMATSSRCAAPAGRDASQ